MAKKTTKKVVAKKVAAKKKSAKKVGTGLAVLANKVLHQESKEDKCKGNSVAHLEEYVQIFADIFLGNKRGFVFVAYPETKADAQVITFGHEISKTFILAVLNHTLQNTLSNGI